MSGFSFKIGGGHRPRFESFSGSGSSSRSRGRHHDTFDDLSEHFANLDAHFDNMFDDRDSDFSRSGSRHGDRMPSGFMPYAGTSSRGRSGSAFDSDSFGSPLDSDFPSMPGRGRPARYETEERTPSGRGESRPFRMWEAKSGSSSRRRSPSPAFYREAPPRAWAPGHHRSPSPVYTRGYGTGNFDSNATARPFYRSPSPPPRRHRSPSPPPRRRRSPSPPPRRRRSPSPPPRPRHTPGSGKSSHRHRSPSPPRYRAEERRPEGASSRTAGSSYSGSSHSRRAPEPAYRGYPNAGRARAQSTSHNQYRGDPPKPKQRFRRDPSPPPRREERSKGSSSRSHSHARSGTSSSSAGSSKPARSRSELKKMFDAYNDKWDALGRTDKNYPLPASSRDLFKLDFMGGSSANTGNWSNEEIFIANVQVIFLAGFGISSTIGKRSDDLKIQIEGKEANREALKSLAKWLSRKEQPRWHPDRMNLRTGKEGKLDESVSKKSDVVAMRTAGQNLLALVNA